MPYPYLGATGLNYTQYLDTGTGRMLQALPGGSYDMQPVPGAPGLSVPPGDGHWGPQTAPPELPASEPDSAPPGAPEQPAPKGGKTTKPGAGAPPEG